MRIEYRQQGSRDLWRGVCSCGRVLPWGGEEALAKRIADHYCDPTQRQAKVATKPAKPRKKPAPRVGAARGGRKATQPCGTQAGYFRHYRAGQPACEPCRQAHAAKTRERQARA